MPRRGLSTAKAAADREPEPYVGWDMPTSKCAIHAATHSVLRSGAQEMSRSTTPAWLSVVITV